MNPRTERRVNSELIFLHYALVQENSIDGDVVETTQVKILSLSA